MDYGPSVDPKMYQKCDQPMFKRVEADPGGIALPAAQLLFVADRRCALDAAWARYGSANGSTLTGTLVVAPNGTAVASGTVASGTVNFNSTPDTKADFAILGNAAHPTWVPVLEVGDALYVKFSGAPVGLADVGIAWRLREAVH